ncbi:HAMP domain-containing sensor histidine kinase [Methylocapsa sp. S129]|uniref:sensor histidine kinase n=1 Tax=Methylocapsa sp. S129 TaxID=1641869 RepID=UPI001FEFA415|nr:HAMP domain-containing sensor histidine kinase [Methylocapsa sp. S129]
MPDIFRSSALRVALAFAIAMTVATSLIFGFVYLQITASDEALVRVVLVNEAEKGANYSDAELRNALDLRLTHDLRRLDYVALFDAAGNVLIGNIDKMPAIPADGKSHFIAAVQPPGAPRQSEPAIFVARLRPDGSVLLLGRSLLEVYALRRTVLVALATAIGPMLLMALAIGAFFARRASLRLTRIHDTIVRIMRGDLQVRLPVRRAPDEIDKVSRDVNLMLDEIVRLLVQIKSVSDNIAHDLRTPLAVMRAKLERGLAGDDDQELRAAARQALAELDRAMRTITALLRISEVESALRSSGFKPIDLSAICADVFEFYEPLGKAKSIAMVLDAKSPVPTLGDGDLMREALSNLIDNAVKFTPEGGTVRIAAAMEAGRPVIRVSDSGSGVAPGERDKIFERFYRTIRNDRVAGSGLGLSIAAAIANLHDFDLRVEDNCPGALFEMSARLKSAPKQS